MAQVRAIQLRRGTKAELQAYGPLLIGELGFCIDTKELYIGTPTGNVLINPDIEVPEILPWTSITDKPSTFPPASHSHSWGSITGKPSTFSPSSHAHAWGEITGKPSTFPPATHSHDYASSSHSHAWTTITGKPATFPPSTHNHNDDYEPKNSNIQSHIGSKFNPHSVTKSQVGLGSVSNYGLATQAEAQAGTSNSKYMTPLRVKEAIAALGGGGDLVPVSGGDTVILAWDNESSIEPTTYTPIWKVKLVYPIEGTLRFSFDMGADAYGSNPRVFARVYRNGSAVGAEHTVRNTVTTTFTEDISGWKQGDEIALYIKRISSANGDKCDIANIKVACE